MPLTGNPNLKTNGITEVASYNMISFLETPRKTGLEKPIARIEAFDLFNLFTADIIRSRKVFTR